MADDRARLIAKSKPSGPCAKGPIHVLCYSGAEAADSIKDPSPHPHVAAAGVALEEDVSLEIKPEHYFPSFYRCGSQRITRSGNHMSSGKVIARERSHSVLDPVRLRLAVAVDER